MLASAARADGDRDLYVRWHRESDRVDVGQERGEVVVDRGVEDGCQVCRGAGVAAPDRGELDAVGGGERGRVRDPRPVAGADQAESQRLGHPVPFVAGPRARSQRRPR